MEMKSSLIALLGLGVVSSVMAADKAELKDPKDKISYSIGINLGNAWKRQSIEVNPDMVVKGLKDAFGGSPILTEAEVSEVLKNYQTELRAKQEEKRKADSEKNKGAGDAFLAENAKKPGVVKLPSGLQYKVLTEGTGPMPKETDTVLCHYRGTLIDGKEFDSSTKRGSEPASFGVTRVIKGWTEALKLMKTGSKWQLYIPADLAYGERGYGPDIPPSATLVFDIELVGIKPPVESVPAPQPVTSDIIKVPSAEELKAGAKIEIIKPGTTNVQTFKPATAPK